MIKVLNIPEFTDGMIVIGVVHPEPWGNGIQFDLRMFFRWVAQPPTSTLMKQMIWKIDFLKIVGRSKKSMRGIQTNDANTSFLGGGFKYVF